MLARTPSRRFFVWLEKPRRGLLVWQIGCTTLKHILGSFLHPWLIGWMMRRRRRAGFRAGDASEKMRFAPNNRELISHSITLFFGLHMKWQWLTSPRSRGEQGTAMPPDPEAPPVAALFSLLLVTARTRPAMVQLTPSLPTKQPDSSRQPPHTVRPAVEHHHRRPLPPARRVRRGHRRVPACGVP